MTQEEFDDVMEQARALREKKNADYGNGFLEAYNNPKELNTKLGDVVIYFDLYRKFKRIENILLNSKEVKVADETVEDTLLDMSIMCMNAIIALRERKK